MLAEMTPEEFAEWRAYERLEPFGTRASMRMLGQILRSQCVEPIDDETVAAIMGYVEPKERIDAGAVAAAITAGFGAV